MKAWNWMQQLQVKLRGNNANDELRLIKFKLPETKGKTLEQIEKELVE